MADLTVGFARDIVKTAFAIKDAVDTVHQNKEECQDLHLLVDALLVIVSRLQDMGLMSHPMTCGALVGLHGSLNRALKLVTKCQKRNRVLHFIKAKDMARQLNRVQDDIHRKMQLGNLAITASMMEITIEMTRTTTVRYDYRHPLLTQPQKDATEMEIYGGHSLTGGARGRPVEDVKEIITTVTTGNDASSGLSSNVAEISLSETVTTHHVSEENNNGGSGYTTVVTTQKTVIKVGMHCSKSRSKARQVMLANLAGVDSFGIDRENDRLVVIGSGVDCVKLISALRKKVGAANIIEQAMWPKMWPKVGNAIIEQARQLAVDFPEPEVPLVEVASAVDEQPAVISATATEEVEQEPAMATSSDLLVVEKPDLPLPQHQQQKTAPVHMSQLLHRRDHLLPAVRQSQAPEAAGSVETAPAFDRSGAGGVRQLLVPCALWALVLMMLAIVWALIR